MQTSELYIHRVNDVMDYIRTHLSDDLTLGALAQVAHFSPFHFHRIFSAMTGETANECVNRLRLERAVALLRAQPKMPITRVALDTGFVRVETFSRAFRKQYGIAARTWDRQSPLKDRKIDQVTSEFPFYTVAALQEVDEQGEFSVELREMPVQPVAFIRVSNSFQPDAVSGAYERLSAWFRETVGDPLTATLYGMSQDDPTVTPMELYRYDICLSLPTGNHLTKDDGEIGIREFPACTLACVHCLGDIFVEDRAWQYLYRHWLPRSRYVPDNLPAMEIYRRQPAEIGWLTYDLDCAIPVVHF
jgi:AraC family transcriptional regulator